MALQTYSELQTAILSWLARPGDPLVQPTVPEFIKLFEAEATRRLKHAGAERRASLTAVTTVVLSPVLTESGAAVTTSSGTAITTGSGAEPPQSLQAAALPDDFGEMRLVTSGSMVLSYVTPMQLPNGGLPQVYTIVGNAIYFGGNASGSVEIVYQSGVPPLSDTYPSNWLLAAHPDVYLFGSLVEAEAFIGHDERIALWAQRREAAFLSIEQADRKARWGGGPLQIRAEGLQIMPSGTVWTPIPGPVPPTPILPFVVYAIPVDGVTLTATEGQAGYQLAPATELSSLTVTLPPLPADQDEFWISSTQTISGLVALAPAAQTMAPGSAGPLTLGAGGRLTWIFLTAQNQWFGQF